MLRLIWTTALLIVSTAAAMPAPLPGPARTSPSAQPDSADSQRMSTAQLRSRLLYANRPATPRQQAAAARSVPLAGALSAVVPGLGQAYNRDWIRSAVAVAVEAGLIAGYVIWKGRGEEGEDAYQEYAHAYWSPDRYADWLNDYVVYLEESDGVELNAAPLISPDIDFQHPSTWDAADRQAVRAFFNEVRAVEDVVYHPETGATFSHNLPYFAEQQYYELIGKYFQFAPGWTDYPAWTEGAAFTSAIDPEHTGPGGSKPNVQGRFLDYAEDHAAANDYLRRASRVSAFAVLNHLVAALDAAISAKLHNDRIETDLSLGHDAWDRPELSAALRIRL